MLRPLSRITALLLLLSALSGCGSDNGTAAGGNGNGGGVVDTSGTLFQGDPAALTLAAITNYNSGDRTTADEISIDADGVEIDRTNLDVALVATATAGEVNTLLESIGAKIVNMVEGVNIILIQIPDPGDLAGLDAVIVILEASPLVDWVQKADMTAEDSLPGNYNPAATDLSKIDHHMAAFAPFAWNASAAIGYPTFGAPLLLQSDYFGNGPPNGDFDLNILNPADFGTSTPKVHVHGYHVLGIMSGRHTPQPFLATGRDLVTGMYPGTLDLRVVDRYRYSRSASENELVKIIRQSGRRIVLNTSLHSGCPRPPDVLCVLPKTLAWMRKLRGDVAYFGGKTSVWEDNFLLHITSAGNFRSSTPDNKDGTYNSQYSAAKLLTGMTTLSGTTVVSLPNTTNTLVIENRINSGAAPYQPGCLASSSKYGEISAMGTNIWSFTNWATVVADRTGTSMSTPQVAALGAYIWGLKPTLKPADVINILQDTASSFASDTACTDEPGPVINAYAAVLAVDDAKIVDPMVVSSPMDAPARLAIFDVTGDGGSAGANKIFDEDDLTVFVNAFLTAAGLARDYSRYDLNGDDLTGGKDKKLYFNLDIDAAQVYESVTQDIDGSTVTYDENAVTDWDILCYYAYSPLYTGSTAERSNIVGSSCGAPKILYSSDSDGDGDIYSMDEAGNNVKNLTNDSLTNFAASLSPDGTRITFIQGDSSPGSISIPSSLIVMDIDGGNKIQVPTSSNGLFSLFVLSDKTSWSPDGTKIVFTKVITTPGTGTTPDTTAANLYVMNADGSGTPQSLTSSTGNTINVAPSWSPDGSKIAFTRLIEVTPTTETDLATYTINIYVMNAAGGGSQNLTGSTSTTIGYYAPDWSPDGTKIAYYINTTSNYFAGNGFDSTDIMVMNANGTGKSTLTSAAGGDINPGWSPDGSKIAFSSSRDGNFEVFVMDADGNNQTPLTSTVSIDNFVSDWR